MDRRRCKVVLYNTETYGGALEEQVAADAGFGGFHIVRIDGDEEVFLREAEDAAGVCIVYAEMTREKFARLPKCEVLAVQSIGVNNVDLDAATEAGICVCNVPDYCVDEVAVHTVGLVLDGARRISRLDRVIRSGRWPDKQICGAPRRMEGGVWGFVAFGKIPRRIAEIAKGFRLRPLAWDPFVDDSVLARYGVARASSLEDLFASSDYISVHSPLLPETRRSIGEKQFDAIRPGAIFVVTGRGGVVDEWALKRAIESGRVAFAGLDVIEREIQGDVAELSPLMGMDQVVITPHVAFFSEESLIELRIKAMRQIVEVLGEKKLPDYLVNRGVAGRARFSGRVDAR
jgi:D-3-phosphoglycerate dehydrogenase